MTIRYKRKKLSVTISLRLYEELEKTALEMDCTEEETLCRTIATGANEFDNFHEIEKDLPGLINTTEELRQELESITPYYGKLSSRNAALTYKCYEDLSENKSLAIKLTGAKATNRSFNTILKIGVGHDEQQERADREIIEKYVLR
jgi:hypothetical protein